MPPPPATPVPSRFLLSKRQGKQTQPTPSQPPSGTQQFHATPRFTASSTPRPASTQLPAFSTPSASTSKARPPRSQFTNENIDSSPQSPEHLRRSDELPDAIAIDSPSESQPSSPEPAERSPKRRRISISPGLEISSQPDWEDEYLPDEPQHDNSQLSEDIEQHDRSKSPVSGRGGDDESGDEPGHTPAQGHPTFQKAPRFKASETPASGQQYQLPEVFSPQRRGAKYVPGGLAGEVRDWLVQIKGEGHDDEPGGFCARLVVDDVLPAPGMSLVRGHPIRDGVLVTNSGHIRAILAGQGRLTGLAKNKVAKGSLIGIAQPTWEVALEDRSRWTVACDWSVL